MTLVIDVDDMLAVRPAVRILTEFDCSTLRAREAKPYEEHEWPRKFR